MGDELRRITRVQVCCRAVVRDRYGVWTCVTEDVSAQGCQLVTTRLLRPGSIVAIALSSDLFPEELETIGEAAWATPDRIGLRFVGTGSRRGALSPEEWLHHVVELGAIPESSSTWRVAPSVIRSRNRRIARPGRELSPTPRRGDAAISASARRR